MEEAISWIVRSAMAADMSLQTRESCSWSSSRGIWNARGLFGVPREPSISREKESDRGFAGGSQKFANQVAVDMQD